MTSQIKLENFKKYLETNEWQILETTDKFIKIKKHFDEDVELLAPNNEDLVDYSSRMKDIIGTIAILENKKQKEVAEEINNIGDA